jgi:hypothetical protein
MTWQIDFGNLAVGIATVFIAMTSIYIANSNLRQIKTQKIAEFRMKWIEDLRKKLAEFCDETLKTIELARKHKDVSGVRIQFLYSYVRLELNTKEKKHRELLQAMIHAVKCVNLFVDQKVNKENDDKITKQHEQSISELFDIADAILKEEWSRIKLEITAGKIDLAAKQNTATK